MAENRHKKRMSAGNNFNAIAKARQDMAALARKEKARKDSTVTILEVGDHVARAWQV